MKLTKLKSLNDRNAVHDTLCIHNKKKRIFGHNYLKALTCEDNLPTFLMHSMSIVYIRRS